MSIPIPTKNWIVYAVTDEIGDIIGIKEDAPDWAKEAWIAFKKNYEEALARGTKL